MLTNFLDHTRYPESLIDSPATGPQSRIFAGAGAKVDVSTGVGLSNSDPIHWLNALQSFHGNGNMPIEKLQELDNAIGILRLEKYIDNSISSEEQTGIKSLVRDCYYWLRPLFPVSFRKYLQRMALRGWDSKAFPAWPVDFTTEKLMDAIWRQLLNAQTPKELPFIWFWPEGQSSCCIMTHDVETALGRDFCGTMMQIEKRHGIYSAFEVVPEQRYEVPEEFLQGIRDNGCEVCLHGLNHDGHLFTSKAVFSERAKKINAYAEKWRAVGFRSPVMYRNLSWLPELRFSYDMSVPNMAHLDPQHGDAVLHRGSSGVASDDDARLFVVSHFAAAFPGSLEKADRYDPAALWPGQFHRSSGLRHRKVGQRALQRFARVLVRTPLEPGHVDRFA